jgi:hypothetical protein
MESASRLRQLLKQSLTAKKDGISISESLLHGRISAYIDLIRSGHFKNQSQVVLLTSVFLNGRILVFKKIPEEAFHVKRIQRIHRAWQCS